VKGLVGYSRRFVEVLQDLQADRSNSSRSNNAVLVEVLDAPGCCGRQVNRVLGGIRPVLQTLVYTEKQFFSLEGSQGLVGILYDPRFFVIDLLYGRK